MGDSDDADAPLLAGDHQFRIERREPPGIYGTASSSPPRGFRISCARWSASESSIDSIATTFWRSIRPVASSP